MAKTIIVKRCEECKTKFDTVRGDAKYCSPACRHRSWRKAQKHDKVKRAELIAHQYAPQESAILEKCPELKPHFDEFIARFGKEPYYVMISVIDYMTEKDCIK